MSKLTYFDFRCTRCADTFEDLVKPGTYWLKCPKCGGNAKSELSPPRINRTMMALSASDSPESIRHFERVHTQHKAKEEKAFADHGDYGKRPGAD
jgi:predicted  nucleic acid-binding Zn-ribbon protein